jgi:hypothetical protein
MRYASIALMLLFAIIVAPRVWAFVSHSVNIAKENGYVILKPPSGDALIAKEGGYAILKPPGSDLLIAKEGGYVILKPVSGVKIAKETAYAIVVPNVPRPSIQILQ